MCEADKFITNTGSRIEIYSLTNTLLLDATTNEAVMFGVASFNGYFETFKTNIMEHVTINWILGIAGTFPGDYNSVPSSFTVGNSGNASSQLATIPETFVIPVTCSISSPLG